MKNEKNNLPTPEEDFHDKTVLDDELAGEVSEDYYPLRERSTRLYSIISVFLAIVSVVLGFIYYYIGIALGVGAIIMALVSRKVLGYFDKSSLFGIVVGIFGVVFGSFVAIVVNTGILDGLLFA